MVQKIKLLSAFFLLWFAAFSQNPSELKRTLNGLALDLIVTGAPSQSALNNNILLATAGTGSFNAVTDGAISYKSFFAQITGTAGISAGNVIFEGSNDSTTFVPVPYWDDAATFQTGPITSGTVIAASTSRFFSGRLLYKYFRCKIGTAFVGGTVSGIVKYSSSPYAPLYSSIQSSSGANVSVAVLGGNLEDVADATTKPVIAAGTVRTANSPTTLIAGDVARHTMTSAGALVTQPFSVPEVSWTYAAAAFGILNTTTAVTIKTALASYKNYITSIQIYSEALGTATELAIRDGAAGTVLWRFKIPTTGTGLININFPTPLKQSAVNTLLEVVTLTATTTGAVYFNAQGYTAL